MKNIFFILEDNNSAIYILNAKDIMLKNFTSQKMMKWVEDINEEVLDLGSKHDQ